MVRRPIFFARSAPRDIARYSSDRLIGHLGGRGRKCYSRVWQLSLRCSVADYGRCCPPMDDNRLNGSFSRTAIPQSNDLVVGNRERHQWVNTLTLFR